MRRRTGGLCAALGVVLVLVVALAGCDFMPSRYVHNYGAGQVVQFGDGFEAVVPDHWSGYIDMTPAAPTDDVDPANGALDLNGPESQDVIVARDDTETANSTLELWRGWATSEHAGRSASGSFEGMKMDAAIFPEQVDSSSSPMIMEIVLWTARGPVSVQVTRSRDLDHAVSEGTSPTTAARDVLRLIRLRLSAG